MTAKEILHKLILGFDPYLSTGVPKVYWDLAITLTREIYGPEGVELLESAHHTYDSSVEAASECIVHSIESLSKWEDKEFETCTEELIAALEKL